jgi:four helix bundle protein
MSRDPEKLEVFHLADALVIDIYSATKQLPVEERYGLQAQIRRAAVSAATNIVEGCARRSQKEYVSFCNIAAGSACETRYLLHLANRLGFLDSRAWLELEPRCTHLAKALFRLIERLEPKAQSPKPKA